MSGSDDSEAEGGPVNMPRTVLRPPGHSGKAKRGHLCFDASFECGNLGRVDYISEFEYDLFLRPDTCNPRYRLWFYFTVENAFTSQPVVFNLINLCKIKTLYRDGMTPLVKTTSRPRWTRLPGKFVYYHKSSEHRNHYILTFAFGFDREEDVYQFAFSFPYSYTRCQAHLDLIDQRKFQYFRRETIGYTLQNRKLDVITIGNPSLLTGKKSKLVVILARCHPGESPSSYVAQGIMDFMISNHPIAVTLREYLVIKICPMTNPDGVYLGNYRCSMMGYDLNRQWDQISPWTHPTLSALQNYFVELDNSKHFELEMVIDIHAHTSLLGVFIHGNSYDDVYRFERHILFSKLLAHNAEDYNPNHTMYNRDPLKSGAARRHLCEILRNTVNVYTLEVSCLGYNHPITNAIISYDEDGYFRTGRNVVRTFLEYFRVTGCIPSTATQSSKGPQNQVAEKKVKMRKKSRSRSRSLDKGEKASSPTQITEISNPAKKEKDKTSPEASTTEDPPDKAVLKLDKLTKEHDSDFENSSTDDDHNGGGKRVVKFVRRQDSDKRRLVRRSSLATLSKQSTSGTNILDSPPTSPNRNPNQSKAQQLSASKSKIIPFKTFDFSTLQEPFNSSHSNEEQDPNYEKSHRHIKASRSKRSARGRKVGGGGVIGISAKQSRNKKISKIGHGGTTSDTDTEAPCLTIIDFNSLVRKDLDGGAVVDGGGCKGLSSAKINPSKTQHDFGFDRKLRRRQTRRREVILRGSLTDCSPVEDSSSDSESAIVPLSGTIRKFSKESRNRYKSNKASFSS